MATKDFDGGLAMVHDPIVEEVRAIREQVVARFDFDIRKIVEDAQRRQTTSKSRIVSFQRTRTALPSVGAGILVSGNATVPRAAPPGER